MKNPKTLLTLLIIYVILSLALITHLSPSQTGRSHSQPASAIIPTYEEVKEIQKELAGLGYYEGKIDGIWRNFTQDAVEAYWADECYERCLKIQRNVK